MRKLGACLVASCAAAAAALRAAPPVWPSDPADCARELDSQWEQFAAPSPAADIRGILRFALEAAAVGSRPERVHRALLAARSMQDADPASPAYGNFRWHPGDARAPDPSAAEFAVELAAFMRGQDTGELPAADRRLLETILGCAVPALRRHPISPRDSSLFLLKAWNLIASGEDLARPDVAEEGYKQLEEWIRYTVLNGVAEFGSPTAYAIDLDALALIAKFAGRPAGRRLAEVALTYLWTDLAGNWWGPGERPGGARSHGADYLRGRADLAAHAWAAGWLGRRPPALTDDGWLPGPHGHQTAFLNACAWVPPEERTEPIRRHVPRVVVQRWSYTPLAMFATNYVGRHAGLAASDRSRADDGETLVVNLGDSPAVAPLTLFMADRPGRSHLSPVIATVQRGPEVLQMLAFVPSASNSPARGGSGYLRTSLTAPTQGEIWSGDRRMEPGAAAAVSPGKPIFVRVGDAFVGVRLLLALASDGSAAPITLAPDPDTPAASRITVDHAARRGEGPAMLVAWFRVGEGSDAGAFAAFRRNFARAPASAELRGSELDARASGMAAPLRIDVDVPSGRPFVLAGLEPDALFGINGEDVGKEILEDYGAQ